MVFSSSPRRIPHWLWSAITLSLGIKTHDDDSPWVSVLLHVLTVASGAFMVFTHLFYSGYDIMSEHTATDVLDGTVSNSLATLYFCTGVYSHRLAYRLFIHPKFTKKLRLHSKTVMKVNAALAIFLALLGFVVVQNYLLAPYIYGYKEIPPSVINNRTSIAQYVFELNGTELIVNPCQTSKG